MHDTTEETNKNEKLLLSFLPYFQSHYAKGPSQRIAKSLYNKFINHLRSSDLLNQELTYDTTSTFMDSDYINSVSASTGRRARSLLKKFETFKQQGGMKMSDNGENEGSNESNNEGNVEIMDSNSGSNVQSNVQGMDNISSPPSDISGIEFVDAAGEVGITDTVTDTDGDDMVSIMDTDIKKSKESEETMQDSQSSQQDEGRAFFVGDITSDPPPPPKKTKKTQKIQASTVVRPIPTQRDVAKMLPPKEVFKVYRRDTETGKLMPVGSFSVKDVASEGGLEGFVKKHIDSRLGPGGEYPVFVFDDAGNEIPHSTLSFPTSSRGGPVPAPYIDAYEEMKRMQVERDREQKLRESKQQEFIDVYQKTILNKLQKGEGTGSSFGGILEYRMATQMMDDMKTKSTPEINMALEKLKQLEERREIEVSKGEKPSFMRDLMEYKMTTQMMEDMFPKKFDDDDRLPKVPTTIDFPMTPARSKTEEVAETIKAVGDTIRGLMPVQDQTNTVTTKDIIELMQGNNRAMQEVQTNFQQSIAQVVAAIKEKPAGPNPEIMALVNKMDSRMERFEEKLINATNVNNDRRSNIGQLAEDVQALQGLSSLFGTEGEKSWIAELGGIAAYLPDIFKSVGEMAATGRPQQQQLPNRTVIQTQPTQPTQQSDQQQTQQTQQPQQSQQPQENGDQGQQPDQQSNQQQPDQQPPANGNAESNEESALRILMDRFGERLGEAISEGNDESILKSFEYLINKGSKYEKSQPVMNALFNAPEGGLGIYISMLLKHLYRGGQPPAGADRHVTSLLFQNRERLSKSIAH